MRELTVRIQFTQPCLGKTKRHKTVVVAGKRKKRSLFLFQRSPVDNRVIFMPQWWRMILEKAAEVQCRLQKEVGRVNFSLEVDGAPRPLPDQPYRRFVAEGQYSPHEHFAAGDTIGMSCVVPDTISDDDFWSLLDTAGQYFGISPFRHGEFGLFRVTGIQRRTWAMREAEAQKEKQTAETK